MQKITKNVNKLMLITLLSKQHINTVHRMVNYEFNLIANLNRHMPLTIMQLENSAIS